MAIGSRSQPWQQNSACDGGGGRLAPTVWKTRVILAGDPLVGWWSSGGLLGVSF